MKTLSRSFAALAVAGLLALTMSSCEMIPPVDTGGSGGDAIVIGLIQPGGYYPSFAEGAKLAVYEINEAGGILGMQIDFIERDNQGDDVFPSGESAIAAARDLIENEGAAAIIGPVFSTNSIALGGALTDAGVKIPVLPGSTSPAITDAYAYTVMTAANNHLSAAILSDFSLNELGASTAAVSRQAADVFSEVLATAFINEFESAGGTIVGSNTYEAGANDFSAQIAELTAANPDAILLTSFAPEVPNFMKQARGMGYEGLFIGGDGWDDAARFYNTLDDNAPLNGSYYTSNFFLTDENMAAAAFADAYEAMFGIMADGLAANGYDAVGVLAQAIEAAGDTDPDAVLAAIQAMEDYQGAGFISRFDENRLAVKGLTMLVIEDGAPAFHSLR